MEPYKGLFSKSLASNGDYEYHLYCQLTEFETKEELKESKARGVAEIQWRALCGYWESGEGHEFVSQIPSY